MFGWFRKKRPEPGRTVKTGVPVVTLRDRPKAGGIADAATGPLGSPLATQRQVTLFIHGFNVDAAAADVAYGAMMDNLPADKIRNIMWIKWPGDMFESRALSAAAYSFIVERVPDMRFKLAAYITEVLGSNPHPKIDMRIVAHSLGCRLTLELLTLLRFHPKVQLEYVALMAAAVPLYKVRPGGLLDITAFGGPQVDVYRSVKDLVLQGAFKPGQFWEADGPSSAAAHRGALGFNGFGDDMRRTLPSVKEHPTNIDHGDYWSSKVVARGISLSLASADRRVLAARKTNPRHDNRGRDLL